MSSPDKKEDFNKEPEITVDAISVPAGAAPPQQQDGPPVPPGHSRFFCEKCRTPYDLPQGSTSWRCARCSTFNSITPGECPMCIIL